MERELSLINIKATRTAGMLPQEAIREMNLDPKRLTVMQNRTPGAIGCHYSQVQIMEEALHRGQHAFVMEDDLHFCEDFHSRLSHLVEFVRTRLWDVIWLGGTFHVNPPYWHKDRDAETTSDPRILRTYGAFCTYAYIVNVTSIYRVLDMLEELVPKSMGIDWAFIQLQPQLYTYAYVPGSVRQIDNLSDIGKGMTVFSNFKKLGPYWFQEQAAQFDPAAFDWKEARQTK